MNELTLGDMGSLTRRVMALLDGWGLSSPDIHKLLDLPEGIKARSVARFRQDDPLPDAPQVLRRVDYLVRIEDALQTYFPRNREMRNLWMKKGNRQFGKRAPLTVMVEGGESGMVSVLSHLDCTYAWDLTGSKAEYGESATNP